MDNVSGFKRLLHSVSSFEIPLNEKTEILTGDLKRGQFKLL
jgi:hypothetical protein